MGFLFRLMFWVGVAVAIMPPEDRPGADGAIASEAGLEERLRMAVFSVWALAADVSETCVRNPDLCAATQNLATTTMQTTQDLVMEIRDNVTGKSAPQPPEDDRVGKFQGRAD